MIVFPEGIKIVPVPMLLIEQVRIAAQSGVVIPPIPTYTAELADGSKVLYEHDAKSLETEEEKALWAARENALRQQEQVASLQVLDLLLARGLQVDEKILTEGRWRSLQTRFHVALPKDLIDLQIHYIRTEIVIVPSDINDLMTMIMEASGIDGNLLQAAKNTFSDKLRAKEDSITRASGYVPSPPEGEMVHGVTVQ